ncbi:hippocampus abundant transcript 1 protein-like [Impatiens glandulifera]|uniref:hippocampus abundant transcript 1 protein-like n=1 Tax=Impatiens glandulifera TaxID=253017 RepID=UPI001FB15520|nr:hippocampus abundant transcript 1 protein-like [Impatiens glandulifera]
MMIGSGLKQLYVTVFLSSFAGNMVFPAMTDVTMAALCPGEDECALAIYLSAFQQSIIGVSTVVMLPLIGKLSDIYGRKALLTFPLTLSVIPLVILACGRTKYFFYAYFVFKTLTAMLTEGSLLCLAVAYVVDVSSEEKRAIGFGMVMGIICASFVGATLAARVLSIDVLFQVSAVVSIVALVYMCIFLKESNFPNESSPLEQPILKEANDEEDCTLTHEESSSNKAHEFRKISSLKDLIHLVKTSRTFSLIVLITFFSVVSKSAMEGSLLQWYIFLSHKSSNNATN